MIIMSRRGSNNPFYGKKHTEESKRKMSESRRGSVPWNKGKECPKTARTLMGHSVSDETKKKISETLKQRYIEGYESHFCKGHKIRNTGRTRFGSGQPSRIKGLTNEEFYGSEKAKIISEKIRAARLKQVFPKKDTSIEIALQEELSSRSIKYKKHVPVCGVCQPDIVFLDKMIAVFADGDYWHRLPHMIEKDRRQDRVLRHEGWKVLRFWQHKIESDVGSCVDEIEGVLGCPVGH